MLDENATSRKHVISNATLSSRTGFHSPSLAMDVPAKYTNRCRRIDTAVQDGIKKSLKRSLTLGKFASTEENYF